MNYIDEQIFRMIGKLSKVTQQQIAKQTNFSLGMVNKSLRRMMAQGLLTKKYKYTENAHILMKENKPQRAIILAAGFGMRMVPINMEVSKGLLEVQGETLIERLIQQLHEVDIWDIYIVVGFMKEAYEYLIDQYSIKLIVNNCYRDKNNLHSLYLAQEELNECYIIPCDIWCRENPFRIYEFQTNYMIKEKLVFHSQVRMNRKLELVIHKNGGGHKMVGIAYIKNGLNLRQCLKQYDANPQYDHAFWEEALFSCHDTVYSRIVYDDVVEINTYEELRELDCHSNHLNSDAIDTICHALHIESEQIINIQVLKKGMTNRSFLFKVENQQYIMRIPGEGSECLINRFEEYNVYQVVNQHHICDEVIYMNADNGYKISRYIENAKSCNPNNPHDLKQCMQVLRDFHHLKLKVSHRFDIFEKIEFYEHLWNDKSSIYKDYQQVKKHIFSLRLFIEQHVKEEVLTHIDAVPDNFLLTDKRVYLIDWEYAGMQDPDLDVAMFCIYSLYNQNQVNDLIDFYFEYQCPLPIRVKIYCYIAVCGLLWSNWCEYKSQLGVEFGEYSLLQYRYAKTYYRLAMESGLL